MFSAFKWLKYDEECFPFQFEFYLRLQSGPFEQYGQKENTYSAWMTITAGTWFDGIPFNSYEPVWPG